MQKLTCRELIDFLDDYVDDCLSPAERARFEHHLSRCEPCVRYLHGYRTTVRVALAACAETGTDPHGVPDELIDAILASRGR